MTSLPWTEKHRPSKVSEIVGNKEAVFEFLNWVEGWLKKRPAKKAVMLYGPAGVGKTSLVHAFARENGWEVIEMNASDFRTKDNLERVVGAASSQASITMAKNKIILVDEVDGIDTRQDAGAVSALVQIIDETMVPVVLVANDPWNPRLAPLREKSLLIQFRRIPKPSIAAHLRRIAMAEKLRLSEEVIKSVADSSGGDLRSAINDLQLLAAAGGVSMEPGFRDRRVEVFEALARVYHSKSYSDAVEALGSLDMDPADFFTWVLDNAPEQLSPQDLVEALENLSKADLFLQRINATQSWHLLRYAIPLMTAGVAVSRKHPTGKFVRFSFPSRVRYLGQTRAERELIERVCTKIGSSLHMSRKKARTEMLPFIKVLMTEGGEGLVKFFGFTEEEAAFLRGGEAGRRRRRASG
ncbi:MAG: replication factor C large subunit [Candidatus Caldarchaeum sp.]